MLVQRLRTLLVGLLVFSFVGARAQTLTAGDIAIVGVNANNGACSGVTAQDEISFFCFKNIVTGTRLWLTDKGYEYQFAGFWGTSEGVIQLQRTGANLPLGSVVTVRIDQAGNPTMVSAGWSATVIVTGMNMNSGGDQIFVMQANAGASFTGVGNMGVFNNCTLLYGFSTLNAPNDWVSFQNSSQRSGLPIGMVCFSMAPTASSDFTKYIGPAGFTFPTFPTYTQRQWIIDIDDASRWASYASCTAYNSTGPTYAAGFTFLIGAGGFVNGRWTGAKNTDWFDCRNWDDAEVPISSTNVVVNSAYTTGVQANCVIGVNVSPPTAVCNSVLVQGSGAAKTLTIQNGGALNVTGGVTVTNSAGALADNGVTLGNATTDGNITAAFLLLSSANTTKGYFRSERPGSTAAFAGNVTINTGGLLDLSSGISAGTISLTGNYSNNDAATAFEELGSTVIFNGNGPQSINTNTFTENFGGITLNKGGGDLTLNAPVVMSGALTLNSGRVMTSDPNGLLTLTSTATTSGANDAAPSFVHGPMVKVGTTPFTFPVGKGSDLREASISNVSGGATDAFIAEYVPADPHVAVGSPIENPPLDHISYCEYWRIDRRVGMPNARISLTWETPASCGVTAPADLRVTWWNGLQWLDRGNDGAWTGNAIAGTLTQADAQQIAFAPGGYWTLGSISSANPLPVELLWFDARPEGSMVRLDWATATERNNDHFTIERSADGDRFTDVTRVPGAGNSTSMLSYTELDPHPLPGLSFYRLRQTDFDGTSTVSAMVPVRMAGNGAAGLVVLTGADAVVGLHDMAAGSAVDVLDMTGRAVWQGRTAVDGRAEVPTAYLGAGAYVLRVSDGTRALSAPFVR